MFLVILVGDMYCWRGTLTVLVFVVSNVHFSAVHDAMSATICFTAGFTGQSGTVKCASVVETKANHTCANAWSGYPENLPLCPGHSNAGGGGLAFGCPNKCSAGRWSDVRGLSSNEGCKACAVGRWSDVPGLSSGTECKACAGGKWSDVPGLSTACANNCSTGKWSSASGLTADAQCKPCGSGRFSDVQGRSVDCESLL